MVSLIQAGINLTDIITHRFPIAEYEKGFEVMRSGRSGKVVLNWESTTSPQAEV